MSNKILTTFDLSETHGNLSKIIVDSFNRANSMWHSLIRLLIYPIIIIFIGHNCFSERYF